MNSRPHLSFTGGYKQTHMAGKRSMVFKKMRKKMPFSFIVAIINMLTKIKVIILHGNKLFEDKEEYFDNNQGFII